MAVILSRVTIQEIQTLMYPIKAGAVFATIALVAASLRRAHHPFPRFGAANQITAVRALIVALIAGLVGEPQRPMLATAAVAGGLLVTLLDSADGWAARRTGLASDFGARFDMEVDALLILVLAVLVWQYEKAGAWVLLSGLLRYLFLAAGWLIPWLRRPLPPNRRRQTICVVQIAGLLLALTPAVTMPASALVSAAALLALCYSFLVDTLWLSHRVP
jgi:phosphatidylglycerophosphate synthase